MISPQPTTTSPTLGQKVWYRQGGADLPALISYIDRDGRATVGVLNRSNWRFLDSVARDPNPDSPTDGLWRPMSVDHTW